MRPIELDKMITVAIQQTLHGYSEGHRLLDGSIKFNDELARVILRMSDLSGSNVVPGFEEYLTGYSIEAVKLYAFAKTWYAAEMPRPGCVWTHTLFIPADCMISIPNLQILHSLFRRPQSTEHFAGYSKAIQFDAKQVQDGLAALDDRTKFQVADLIETLYRQNKENVLVGTQTSRSYEQALFRIWSQQWPRLRRSFTFCTGALSARGFNGRPFDFQCSPHSLVREITATSAAKHSQNISPLIKADQQDTVWFAATEDAIKPNGGIFRQLLWAFADAPDRQFYEPLAQLICNLLNSSECSIDEIIALVAKKFPAKDAGYALKSACFGPNRNIPGFKSFEEGQILVALATTSFYQAFDSEALLLKSRGGDLCNRDMESARFTISRLLRSPLNRIGEDVLAGMVESMTPDIARVVTAEQPHFLSTLFRAKPELAMSAELWLAAGDRKRELFEALVSQANLNDGLIQRIGMAMLESNSDYLLKRALDTWGQPIVFGVFESLTQHNGRLSERVHSALTFHVGSIVKWILLQEDAPQNAVIAAAHIIAPFTHQFRQFDSSVWLKTFKTLVNQGNQREANYFAAMLLALGFQNAPPESLTLVEQCFECVHQAAWDDELSDDTWLILDPIVPHLWWHRDWDRCERLRRGLVEAFVKFRWPLVKLVESVKNEAFLVRVIESATYVDGGKELVSEKM